MRYNRVFLIKPDYPESFCPIPVWPSGLGHIAESLKAAGVKYQVMDLGFGYKSGLLYRRIREFQPDAIALSLMTSKYKHHYALINSIKRVFPGSPVVAGGPHVSTLREKVLLDCPAIDYGITMEGEETIVELCEGRDPARIKGLIYRDGTNVAYTGDRKRIADLDSIPFPTYDGFEREKYDARSMNIMSSRGCPYGCIYCCARLVIGNGWKARSPQSVITEIEYWHDKGYRVFNFNDDAFNIDRRRIFEICDAIGKKGMKIELNAPNGIRADRADRALLTRMKEAGFRYIAFGVEAGNNRILSNIRKGETAERIEEAVKNACELGYEVALFFLIGSPGESEKDIEDSFRLAARYPIVDVRFYNLIPFPRTELYDWVERNGYFVLPAEEYLNKNMHWSNEPAFLTPELSIAQRRKIYRRGLRLGNQLRKEHLFRYYRKGFRKFGLFGDPLAYFTSRNTSQLLLKKNRIVQALRLFLKRHDVFTRDYPSKNSLSQVPGGADAQKRGFKLAVVASHATTYHNPLFPRLAGHPEIDLMVYFCTDWGLSERKDDGFGNVYKWDIPLLEGFKYRFLKNWNLRPNLSFFGQINPGAISELRKERYDAVLINGWASFTNVMIILGAFLAGCPVFLRGENPLNQEMLKPKWKIKIKKTVFKWFFGKVKAFLYIGDENKNFYKYYGVPDEKLFFCPYAVDNERYIEESVNLKDRKAAIKKSLNIKPEKVVILSVGKLVHRKRPFDVLKAYEKVRTDDKALVFMGDGALGDELRSYAKKNGLKDVHFLGFKNRTESPAFYALGDIFVFASESGETWGVALNEAMCFKMPVIVSDLIGSARDLVRHDENGYVYPVGRTDRLSFYLEDLVGNKEKRTRFGEKSFELVQRYSYEKDVEGILAALESVKI